MDADNQPSKLHGVWQRISPTVKPWLRWIGALSVLSLLVNGSKQLHDDLDTAGLVSHSADTEVMLAGDWMTGEYKTCRAILVYGRQTEQDGPGPHLYCTNDEEKPFHTLPVKYWGRLERPGTAGVQTIAWKCQRSADGLTCWAE